MAITISICHVPFRSRVAVQKAVFAVIARLTSTRPGGSRAAGVLVTNEQGE